MTQLRQSRHRQQEAETQEDKRLDRLFDYTKFHIGIYLSVGGGMIGLLGTREDAEWVQALIVHPRALTLALASLALAGMAGGVVGSSIISCKTFESFWDSRQGPFGLIRMPGRFWASFEHGAFWLSIGLFAYSILGSSTVWRQVWSWEGTV
jgi:hypothetical protein